MYYQSGIAILHPDHPPLIREAQCIEMYQDDSNNFPNHNKLFYIKHKASGSGVTTTSTAASVPLALNNTQRAARFAVTGTVLFDD